MLLPSTSAVPNCSSGRGVGGPLIWGTLKVWTAN